MCNQLQSDLNFRPRIVILYDVIVTVNVMSFMMPTQAHKRTYFKTLHNLQLCGPKCLVLFVWFGEFLDKLINDAQTVSEPEVLESLVHLH